MLLVVALIAKGPLQEGIRPAFGRRPSLLGALHWRRRYAVNVQRGTVRWPVTLAGGYQAGHRHCRAW